MKTSKIMNWSPALAISATLMSLSSTALAGHYSNIGGPAVDVNFIHQKPAKYAECDKYAVDGMSARVYAACEFGRDEAERLAERFGGGNGRLDGFIRGYTFGLERAYEAYQNDGNEMAKGAGAISEIGQNMEAGLEQGRVDGRTRGSSQGRSDAIDRFEKVVDKGVNPDATLRVPETHYEGMDDAYQKLVGPLPTPQQIIKENGNLGRLKIYDSYDSPDLDGRPALSVWDLFLMDGVYKFEKAYWFDQDLAAQVWMKRPNDQRPKYDNLNGGNPVIDPKTGLPMDLQEVFKSALRNSYRYYVEYYYSREFHQNIDQGAVQGEQVGQLVGKNIAYKRGQAQAFNQKFKESSKQTFRDAFVGAYTENFNKTFQDYNTSAKLSLKLLDVIESENDGIFQPGEQISVRFRVRNVGGVGSALTASLTGDVQEVQQQQFQVGRLQSQVYTAPLMARLSGSLKPRDVARIRLTVNGLSDDLNQTVQRMIELSRVRAQLNVTNGSGDIYLVANNVSTVRTPGNVQVTLKLNNRDVMTQNLGNIDAGNSPQSVLTFSNIDPLELIRRNVNALITVSMNGSILDQAGVELTVDDPELELARYFTQVANGRGLVPAGVSRENRLSDLRLSLSRINEEETRSMRKNGPNLWKKDPGATMVGKLVELKTSTDQSEAAVKQFDQLAKQLWEARKNLPKFLFIKSGKRGAYEGLVKRLSKSGKL